MRQMNTFNMFVFQVAGLESDCMFKANERMVLRIYLTTLSVDDLSDMTLYPKVWYTWAVWTTLSLWTKADPVKNM